MRILLIFHLIAFTSLQLTTTEKFPVSPPKNVTMQERTTKNNSEIKRHFPYDHPMIHSPPIYFYQDVQNNAATDVLHSSLLVKKRPPIPPPPYPPHMIERWENFYGYSPHPTRYPYPLSYHPKPPHYYDDKLPGSIWWDQSSKNEIKPITTRKPAPLPKPTKTIQMTTQPPQSSSQSPLTISNHKNSIVRNFTMQMELGTSTRNPLAITQTDPLTVIEPLNDSIKRVSNAKQKNPSVIFSRPITIVHPDRYVNTTVHGSNIIVAHRPRPTYPSVLIKPPQTSPAFVAIRPPAPLLPFVSPIVLPTNMYSNLVNGMQAMNNFLRSTMWGAIAMFLPTSLLALTLYAATNRDGNVDLPPVPSLNAGRFKRRIEVRNDHSIANSPFVKQYQKRFKNSK